MKTKIRTFIGLVALGMIGFTNMNATAGNINIDLFALETVEAEESLVIEEWMLEGNFWTDNSKAKTETVVTEKNLEIEPWMIDENFFSAAESYTASGSDEVIEKYATKQLTLMEKRNSK